MKTMQEILEGLGISTLNEWKKACENNLESLASILRITGPTLINLLAATTQYHNTMWAVRLIKAEIKRRDELADANRKRLGLDQPDLGESLWLDGYGEQLDPDQERRLSVQKRIREKLDKLPPMVTPPPNDPRWRDLELIPEKGDRVRVVCGSPPSGSPNFERKGARTIYRNGNEHFTFQDFDVLASGPSSLLLKEALPPVVEKLSRICGNCVNRIATPEYPDGWCSWGGFPATANGAGPEHCGKFDPRPVKEVPTFEASNGDKLLKVCGNCANWSTRHFANPNKGFCNKLACVMDGKEDIEDCKYFDPLPLPQTPPAEAVAALDHLPTQEEFDPNDPRR